MRQYIEFVADCWLSVLGVEKYYKVKNPFQWMDWQSMRGKTSFFEKRVAEYARADISASTSTTSLPKLTADEYDF